LFEASPGTSFRRLGRDTLALMFRIALVAAMIDACGGAWAQGLPEIDIEKHCSQVNGGAERIATCTANENNARVWLQSHRINPSILYGCSHTLDLVSAGYVMLRSCILAKHHQ
jgi:hypothetical protein